jgi:hypothetical protein
MAQTFLLDGPVAVVGSANSGNILPILPKIADKYNTRPESPFSALLPR